MLTGSRLQILDADKGERLESSTGRVASRDIVQFVPFRDVQSKSFTHSNVSVMFRSWDYITIDFHFADGPSFVQELLAELPTQFLAYMRSREIKPCS